jgi:hypothetical protein
MQPNWIGVPSNELVHIHTVDGRWSLDPFLLLLYENSHVLLLPMPLFSLSAAVSLRLRFAMMNAALFRYRFNHEFRPVRP